MHPAVTPPTSANYAVGFTRLCHLAALSRGGKVSSAVESLVLGTLAVDEELATSSVDTVDEAVYAYWGLHLPLAELDAALERLRARGDLVPASSGAWRLLPETLERLRGEQRSARELEQEVRAEWISLIDAEDRLKELQSRDDQLWNCLRQYLTLAFKRHGILALELLGAPVDHQDGDGSLGSFLDAAIARSCPNVNPHVVEEAIALFFDSPTPARTRYLTQLLDATFTYFALTVDDATSEYLREAVQPLKVFLDTNFIFGVLGLHQPYFVGLSKQLVHLVQTRRLPFTLYYHERTLREFRDVVTRSGAALRDRSWSKNISKAAVQYGEQTGLLTGLELAYHRLNAESPVSPDVFLTKYEHVDRLLDGLGILVYRDGTPDEEKADEKYLKIAEYDAFVRAQRPDRPRHYNALDHDVAVWMSVQPLRRSGSSVLDSGAIILTNDYLYRKFDWTILREGRRLGTVVVAPQLLQILRPFVPTTDDFDRHFVENLALPEFRVVHHQYGDVGREVLSFLSTYRDVPEPTAIAILTDEVLMTRLAAEEPHSDEFRHLIEAAVVEDNRQLVAKNEELAAELARVRELAGALARHPAAGARVDLPNADDGSSLPATARVEPAQGNVGPAGLSVAGDHAVENRLRATAFVLADLLVAVCVFQAPAWIAALASVNHLAGYQWVALAGATTILAAVFYPQHRTAAWVLGGVVAACIALSQVVIA